MSLARRRSVVFGILAAVLAGTTGSASPVRAATVFHVPADFATIQGAIDASVDGDTVQVSPGTYVGKLNNGGRNIVIESTGGPAVTIIDGGLHGPVVRMDGATGESPTIRGFTIRNGLLNAQGAGVLANGPVVIEGNSIVDNKGCSGMGVFMSGFAIVRDNLIARNGKGTCPTNETGGALAVAASSQGTVDGNTIVDNMFGGGIRVGGSAEPTIKGNIISRNTAGPTVSNLVEAGGITLVSSKSAGIFNNRISANTGTQVAWNGATLSPGPFVVNNTIVATSGTLAIDSGAKATIRNNVITGSVATALVICRPNLATGLPTIDHNDAYNPTGTGYSGCGAQISGNGNLAIDPHYVDPAGLNYHLRPDSALIDAGSDLAPGDDFDGESRPFDGNEDGTATPDIGFDESKDPLQVYPPRLDFGNVPFMVDDAPIVVTLKDYGPDPLTITSASLSGSGAVDYRIVAETCIAAPLAPLGSCTVKVGFKPSLVQTRAATLTIVGPAPVGTRKIPLTGIGTDPISVTPTALSFGDAVVGVADAPIAITVHNAGGQALPVSSLTFAGTNATDFSAVSQTCAGSSLPAGGSCTITVGFKPRNVGARTATLSIVGASPVGTRKVTLSGKGLPPPSGIGWGSIYPAGPAYIWESGTALGRTVESGTQRLHLAYATDRIGSTWAANGGPYLGVYYTRSTNGSTWSTGKRLNPTTQHAARVALAATGARVYVTWVSQAGVTGVSVTAPRVLYVRANSSHGASTSWKSTIRITSTTGRVDFPTIAASGDDAHIAWTDAATGSIRIATSRDKGATWKQATVGTTTVAGTEGFTGEPSVAASGSTVVVAWRADSAGTVKARTSLDRGVSWGAVETVGSASIGFASVAVRDKRVAVAWTTSDDVIARFRYNGTWGAAKVVSHLTIGAASIPYAPVVMIQDPSRLAVVWTEQPTAGTTGLLRWAESPDNGKLWFQIQTISTTASTRAFNDWASVAWPSAGTRYVVWNGWTPNSNDYRLYFRAGTGTPVGPTFVAPAWNTSPVRSAQDEMNLLGTGSRFDRSTIEWRGDLQR